MTARSAPVSGGGRRIEVEPERLRRWLDGVRVRHGDLTWSGDGRTLSARAADGTTLELDVPFPPLGPGADLADALEAHAVAVRRVGLLLVRLGGWAVGVAVGPRLEIGATGRRPVHGRAAAGGWSQQRFARRRENQAAVALDAAATAAVRVLLPEVGRLAGLVVGGDRRAVGQVLDDPRLAALTRLRAGPLLDVPDPRRAVLEAAVGLARRVPIVLREPAD